MSPNRRPPLLALLAIGTALIAAFALGRFAASGSSTAAIGETAAEADANAAANELVAEGDADDPARALSSAGADKATTVGLTDAAPSALPLPPPDAPLAEVIDDLEGRARRGDARAACRLGKALTRCHRTLLAAMANRSDQDIADAIAQMSLEAQAQDAQIRSLMAQREFARTLSDYCAGIGREQTRQALRFQIMAAQSGHADSIVAVGTFPSNAADDLIADPQLATLLHQYRLPMLIEGIRLGDPDSLRRLLFLLPVLDVRSLAQIPEEFRSVNVINILHEVVAREIRGDTRTLFARDLARGEAAGAPSEGAPSGNHAPDLWRELSAALQLFDQHFAGSPRIEATKRSNELQRSMGTSNSELMARQYWQDDCEAAWSSSD